MLPICFDLGLELHNLEVFKRIHGTSLDLTGWAALQQQVPGNPPSIFPKASWVQRAVKKLRLIKKELLVTTIQLCICLLYPISLRHSNTPRKIMAEFARNRVATPLQL